MESNKKYIVFNHFNPETLYFVKNIPQDSWIWDSDYIIEDVTDKHGNCLIENNDEYISVDEMGDKTLSDFDKEIIASLKQAIQEDPDEDYLCAYTSEYREFCFEKDELPDDLDSMTPFTDFVENSYVDGDSSSQYQVINLDTEEFGEFGVDIFTDEADSENLSESLNKTYTVTVKYHNEPKEKIEAKLAKDREDLEYQLNMDDEVEWYDFDESQFNEGLFDKKPTEVKIGVFAKSGKDVNKVLQQFNPKSNESSKKVFVNTLKRLDPNKFEVLEYTVDKKGVVQKGKVVNEYNSLLGTQAKEDQEKRNAELKKQPHWTIDPKTGAKKYRDLVDAEDIADAQFNEGYSKEGYSWDEINGMIHIYEDGKLIDKYPDMEAAEEAGWDLNELNESLDQMREKALKMKEDSNAFAILYGYRTKDGKEVDLEPEEFATEEEYKERIQQITNSFTKLSDKDPRGNRYGKESGIEFYTIYPNKNSNISESTMMDILKAKYPVLDNTWTMGGDKTKLNNEEFELLYALADKLTESSPNSYKYEVKLTYEDYGAGMKWYNIICYDKKGNSWQVLNTKEWLDLMNTGDVDKAYQDVINGDYFQDKQKDIKDMNMGELFNHMED